MNKKIAVLILIVIIIVLAVILGIKKAGNREQNMLAKSEIAEDESEIRKDLEQVLGEIEEEYQNAVKKYDKYTRSDFYNETRMNMKLEKSEISIVNKSNINSEEIYAVSGEQVSEVQYEEEISNTGQIIENNNYIIRVSSNNSIYTYYYLFKVDKKGRTSLNLKYYTKNEIDNEYDDFEMLENELTDSISEQQ